MYDAVAFRSTVASVRNYVVEEPIKAGLIALGVGVPLKFIQRKIRFARLNTIRMKYGFTDDPASFENMTVEQAQEVESNMAEVSICHSCLNQCATRKPRMAIGLPLAGRPTD